MPKNATKTRAEIETYLRPYAGETATAGGMTSAQVAAGMGISRDTAKRHLTQLRRENRVRFIRSTADQRKVLWFRGGEHETPNP